MIDALTFYRTGEHDCSYLAGQKAQTIFLDPQVEISQSVLETLNGQGFRRSGSNVYRPECKQCHACESTRVITGQFTWRRSFKRILKLNQDVQVNIRVAEYQQEHYDLFERYINERHSDGDMYPTSEQQYSDFLIQGYAQSYIVEFRLNGKLLGCTVIDLLYSGLSAIYTWFDPDYSDRSIGSFAILELIKLAIRQQLPYVYLGYWIKDSAKMNYKSRFQPLESYKNDSWQEIINESFE